MPERERRPQCVVSFQELPAVVPVARRMEQTFACRSRWLVLSAGVVDVPEAPEGRNPLRGISQLIDQLACAQVYCLDFGRARAFQCDQRRTHVDQSVKFGRERLIGLRQRLDTF